VRVTIALTASLSLVALCCNPGRALAAETAHAPPKTGAATSFDPRDFTGIWMQTPERPFKAYPLTPEYEAILKQRRADEAAGKPFQVGKRRRALSRLFESAAQERG
jgi:hypothetical protein